MKKWLLLLIITVVLTSMLSATTIKVAVLPLKRLDSASKYIQQIMKIRDLEHTFKNNDKFELIDLNKTAEVFKESDIIDIDEMEKSDMAELGKELNADVVIMGVINSNSANNQTFTIQFKFYSMKTDDLKSQRVEVEKNKKKRWKALQDNFINKLSEFISEEVNKIEILAIQDYHSENYIQAEQGFNTILNYTPGNNQAYYYLGLIALNQKNYDKAITNLKLAIPKPDSLTTKEVVILQNLSKAYEAKGDKNNMIASLVKIADLQNDEELWLSIANLYAEDKQVVKAEEALIKSIVLNQKFLPAQYRLGFLYYDNGRYDDAIPFLEIAAVENPDNDLVTRRLAYSYQKAGRISEAINRYENIIKNNPSNINAYLNLVGLYRTAASEALESKNQVLANENNQKALNTLNNLKMIDSENAIMYLRYADVYLSMNKDKDSETNANLAISKDNSMYQPYIILATINQRRGTDQFNIFIEKDKLFGTKYGREADRIAKERDAAKSSANQSFRKAEEQLKAAKARTNEPEIISDLDNKLVNIAQLIAQSGKTY